MCDTSPVSDYSVVLRSEFPLTWLYQVKYFSTLNAGLQKLIYCHFLVTPLLHKCVTSVPEQVPQSPAMQESSKSAVV